MNISKAKFVTQADFDDAIASNVESREKEIMGYMVAEAALTAAAASMSDVGNWPANLVKFKGVRPDHVAEQLSGADLTKVNALQHRDQVKHLLITNGQEMAKSEASLAALHSAITATKMTAAVTRVKAASAKEVTASSKEA